MLEALSDGLADDALACTEREDYVLTHELVPAGPVQPRLIQWCLSVCQYSETSHRRYQEVPICRSGESQDQRGDLSRPWRRVTSIIHKDQARNTVRSDVIRPTRILPRFCLWRRYRSKLSHFSFSHSERTVLHKIDRTKQRVYVTCGERELRFGMQWSVEYSLGADDDFLTQRAVFHNPGSSPHPGWRGPMRLYLHSGYRVSLSKRQSSLAFLQTRDHRVARVRT